MGRPPYLTDEEREASRIRQNRRRTLATNARHKARRAAEAIAAGREPGRVGNPVRLTADERKLRRRESVRKWKNANLEEARKRDAERQRGYRAQRAIADGRPVGRIGRIKVLSDEEVRKRQRNRSLAYWAKNPEKRPVFGRQYYETHKEEVLANCRTRRARKRGNGGRHTAADVAALWENQNGLCAFCSKSLGPEKPHVDHWVPIAKGGSNGPENLRLLHALCNRRKAAKLPSEFGL